MPQYVWLLDTRQLGREHTTLVRLGCRKADLSLTAATKYSTLITTSGWLDYQLSVPTNHACANSNNVVISESKIERLLCASDV